ncbi:protein of unknown function [[Clostridium] ultunense Esp]|uniref:Uncharacterized protein n=1 Tax=[Clostridium] ultunense Esp TaxID=1288971 RepID=A0A1M4PKQ0_9FIRM|nr:protein of unknown function [[Clostridium] ultunense Esp]SHD75999.1 protein of unknown function [[Clostridium] ultunense Esp]SHD76535.1 protein of unknown function [[Clostridium] ultunense Esp]SHD76891.1 protein of unknown function [[Clostridium] ultunense Esp]
MDILKTGQEKRMIIRMAVDPRVLTYLDSPRVQRSVALVLLLRNKTDSTCVKF